MLKIKDDVDLKELEKFGFKYRDDDGRWFWSGKSLCEYLCVYCWNRKIAIESIKGEASLLLIDLYNAGLVEKVGE